MQTEGIAKPLPEPTALSQKYWEGLSQGRLLLQKCGGCGKVRHYPRLLCDTCHSLEVDWIAASGRGAVHSWTVAHHAFHPAFKADLPYTLLIVDLEEGVRAMGRYTAGTNPPPKIGLPVRFLAQPAVNGFSLPSFTPIQT